MFSSQWQEGYSLSWRRNQQYSSHKRVLFYSMGEWNCLYQCNRNYYQSALDFSASTHLIVLIFLISFIAISKSRTLAYYLLINWVVPFAKLFLNCILDKIRLRFCLGNRSRIFLKASGLRDVECILSYTILKMCHWWLLKFVDEDRKK